MFVTTYTPTQNWLNNKNQVYEGGISTQGVDSGNDFTTIDPEEGGGNGDDPTITSGGSLFYPSDCDGYVYMTFEETPYPCGCGDWPWDACVGCSGSPTYPGYKTYLITIV